ncbi:MAG: CPBP family intramembrane metalloprotease [Bdellovibrionaceae bacterium]|nr:CPBP family intramembrane metalloprotease [Pseudobdellovibrionaceae bacterium]
MNSETNSFEFFQFRKFFGVGQGMQICFASLLFLLMTLGYFLQVKQTGKVDGYTPGVSLLFVPLYEELIFRGILLKFFEKSYGAIKALVFVSILFGLWHLKNIFWLGQDALISQIVYTSFF